MIKKIVFTLLVLCTVLIQAQEKEDTQKNYSEVKLNALYAVVGAFEVSYERTLNEETAFGASFLIPYESIDSSLNYYFSPYYRHYFGKKHAAGFFVEGFGMLSSEDRLTSFVGGVNGGPQIDAITDFALGIGLGGKWVSKKGFVGELNLGIGRNLFNADQTGTELVAKLGITVGWRF
jgi:hypothetical protein